MAYGFPNVVIMESNPSKKETHYKGCLFWVIRNKKKTCLRFQWRFQWMICLLSLYSWALNRVLWNYQKLTDTTCSSLLFLRRTFACSTSFDLISWAYNIKPDFEVVLRQWILTACLIYDLKLKITKQIMVNFCFIILAVCFTICCIHVYPYRR